MSTTIPTTISICIATTLSCFILFTLPSEQKRIDMQAASEGLAQSAQKIPPTKQPKININQCGQIDDRFAKHLPDGSIWTVSIDDKDCEQAQLEIQLPESNIAPWPVSPTATNITLKEGSITWSESLNHSHIQTPYMARLVGAQTEPDQCLILKCGGDDTGVDITPPEASFTMANDDVEQVTGNLIDIATNTTNDDSLELSGYCESKSSKVTIYNDRTKLAEVNCNCPNSEDNTEAKTKTATKITTEPKQESKCIWAYTVSIEHSNTYQLNVTEKDWINNISPATANFEVTVDTEAPRVSKLTLSDNLLTSDEVATVTLTFSEAIKDFNSVYHITAQNGTLTPMASVDQGKTWTGTFTPNTDIIATGNIIKVNNTYIDIAGNTGAPYQTKNYTIDTKVLAAPSFFLDKDTGISDVDNITYNRQVNVDNDTLVPGAKWKYSLDSGQNWQGSSNKRTFLLAENAEYEPKSIQVRQISLLGNLGEISKNPEKIIIDNKQPVPPSFALVNDTGRYNNDNITQEAQVSVEIEQNASWQYRLTKAQNWQDGSDKNFFMLVPNTTYKAGDIQVIQTDVAGNNSGEAPNQADFIIDTKAPVPLGFRLVKDTGANKKDNITANPKMEINKAVLETDAIWHYSLDAGKSWTEGSGFHFDLRPDTYLAGDIQVTQTDLAGNISPVTSQEDQTSDHYLPSGGSSSGGDGNDQGFSPVNEEPILFDDTPPTSTISFALNKDTGSSSTDFITKNPQMD
ncbi:MAG: Ig-like domain-containing protein, partial [Pseudomonadales bacterium]